MRTKDNSMVLMIIPSYIDKLKEFEGLRLQAYKPRGEKSTTLYTIGYGHYGVQAGTEITPARAGELLHDDLFKIQDQIIAVLGYDRYISLSLSRTTALIDFVFNLGIGNLKTSTLLKKILRNVEDRSIQYEFLRWNKSGGRVLRGLTKRCSYRSNLWYRNSNV